jgi:hypothetical protein
LRTTLTDQNYTHDEITTRLKSGNACSHSVSNLLFLTLLSKNIKIKTCRTIILSVALYGCNTWFVTLSEECRLTVFLEQGVKEGSLA